MQFQKHKLDEKKKKLRKSRSPEYDDSDLGEMNYADPTGNQYINTNAQEEQNININEQQTVPVQPSLQGTISQIKNELRNRMGLSQIMKENPIESMEVNIPKLEPKSRSPKTINIGESKEDIEYNIRTLNNRKSPPNVRTRQNMGSSDNLSGTDAPYQQGGEVQIQGLPDYRNQRQISFNPKGIILRSPNAPKRFKEFVYMPNDRSEENIRSPSNEMSPNINYEEMNNSGMGSRKGEDLETKNYLKTNTGNIFTSKANLQRKQTSGKQKILTNLSASGNSVDELQDKLKRPLNNNMNMGEVKRIMRRFTKIYDPNKNNNGALLGSTQVTLPGGQDEIFNNRYHLAKMNRLSSILLSNRNRSPMIGSYNRASLLNRSKSRSLSRESLDKSIREKSVKKPRNKFLYVSLAMLSSKGPSAEDRIILRRMRLDKGGVVDLAQEQRKKAKYRIRQVFKSVRPNSLYHMNPKYREKAAKIIQDWWKELKIVNSDRLKKIILIQSVYRGKWIRKNMYDLLYLNYLYICFCKKIEKVLLSNLRPYVFGKLFYNEKQKKELLTDIIQRKDENILRPYWNFWLKAIKSQHLINEASRKLLQIRSNKENKLSILLAFFNKWKYICRIGVPKDYDENEKDKDDISPDYNKVMPTGKLKCLVNILDATNKYTKAKAMDKILNKVMKYLTVQAKKTKLLKLIAKKPIYEKILMRKKLYLWYRQMVNMKHSFSSEDKLKVYEMKRKIFSLTFVSTIKRVYRRIDKIYFRKLYVLNVPKLSDKKYGSIYDLIRDKLSKNEDFEEGVEETYDIDDKIYTIIRKRNDLFITDDTGNKSKLENYKDVVNKKRYTIEKKGALIPKKGKESGNIPYDESEEQQESEEQINQKVKKKKRPSSEISGKEIKKRKKEQEESYEQPEEEDEGSERRSRFSIVEEKARKRKPKGKGKGIIEEIYRKKKEGKIIETRTKKKIPNEEEEEDEEEYTEKIIKEKDSDGVIRKKKVKVPKTKKPQDKYKKPEEAEESEDFEEKPKSKQTKKTTKKETKEKPVDEIDEATGAIRPKTFPKKPVKTKYTNKNGEIVEEIEEQSGSSEDIQKYDKQWKKTQTVDKKRKPEKYGENIEQYKKPKKIRKTLNENGERIEEEETPNEEESEKNERPIYQRKGKEKIPGKKTSTKRGEEIEVEEEENEDNLRPKATDKPKQKKYIKEQKKNRRTSKR